MTVLQAAEALKANYGKIDPSWGRGHSELTSAILKFPALELEKFLIESGQNNGPRLRSPVDYQKIMEPVTEPLEAGQIMLAWMKEKAHALRAEEAAEAADEQASSPSTKQLDYDQLMCFFANEKVSKIVELAQNRPLLAQTLLNYYQPDWGSLEPDTIDAQEAATSDGEMYNMAEERIYRLLDTSLEAFKVVVDVLEQEWPDSGLASWLDGYRANRDPSVGWQDPSKDDADEDDPDESAS